MPTPAPPQYCPTPRELDDLELLAVGALAPTVGVRRARQPGDAHPARRRSRRPPRRPAPSSWSTRRVCRWPASACPGGVVDAADPRAVRPVPPALPLARAGARAVRRPHRRPARRRPHRGRDRRPRGRRPAAAARPGRPRDARRSRRPALIRATLAAADLLPDAAVVAVPLAAHGDADADHALGLQVVANYAGPIPVIGVPDSDAPSPPAIQADRRPGAARPGPSRAWCSSSPACPAAASRRSPAR